MLILRRPRIAERASRLDLEGQGERSYEHAVSLGESRRVTIGRKHDAVGGVATCLRAPEHSRLRSHVKADRGRVGAEWYGTAGGHNDLVAVGETLDALCKYLDCTPADLIEYVAQRDEDEL